MIPPPRSHRHHYHGAFAPGARLRPKVVILAMLQHKIIRSDCPIEERPRATYQWDKKYRVGGRIDTSAMKWGM